MRKLAGWAFAIAFLGLTTASLRADDKLVPEDGALEVMLLRQHAVREELKLSHSESAKIDSHAKKQYEKAQNISKLPEAERDKKFEELTMENHRFIDKTITKDQRKRLQEIELQVGGLMCLSR